ncbi:MAG: HD domain-containing protein [Fimbriimonadaceae bacterium]|nr:HD domain-containing protein [Fimbriimonadaceae bacterium]
MSQAARQQQVLDFLRTLDGLKSVSRSAWLTDGSRRENDAEHTWHMAMFALLLPGALGLELDRGRLLELVLCHDLVEVLVGDVNVYDTAARAAQQAKEEAAAAELFGLLPADLRDFVAGCWQEFEHGDSPEARFARGLDRLQAISQNAWSGGRAWRERGITEARSRAVNAPAWAASPALEPLFEQLFRAAREEGLWAAEPPAPGS